MANQQVHRSVDGKITHITSSDGTQVVPIRDVSGRIIGYDVNEPLETSGSTTGGYCRQSDEFVAKTVTSFWTKILRLNMFTGLFGLILAILMVILYVFFDIDVTKWLNR